MRKRRLLRLHIRRQRKANMQQREHKLQDFVRGRMREERCIRRGDFIQRIHQRTGTPTETREEASKIYAVQPLPDPAPRKYRAIQDGYHGNISQRFNITANHRRNPDREKRTTQTDEHKIRMEFILDPSVYSTEEMITSDTFIFNVTNAVENR